MTDRPLHGRADILIRDAVLHGERCENRAVLGVHMNGGAVLSRRQENLGYIAVRKSRDRCGITLPDMFEVSDLIDATVREFLPHDATAFRRAASRNAALSAVSACELL